jgi:hypothetical protein
MSEFSSMFSLILVSHFVVNGSSITWRGYPQARIFDWFSLVFSLIFEERAVAEIIILEEDLSSGCRAIPRESSIPNKCRRERCRFMAAQSY